MAVFAELVVEGDEALGAARAVVGAKTLVIGRSATCDVVVDRTTVSREHATLWVEGDKVMVRDLRSRNGTFVNDKRVETAEILDGDLLRLGQSVSYRVQVRELASAGSQKHLALEVPGSGHRFLLGALPVRIGSGPDCAVRLPDGPAVRAVFVSPRPGEVWCGSDDDMEEVPVGRPFTIGDREFRVVEVEMDPGATTSDSAAPWPYRVRATLDGEGGPVAVVEDGTSGRKHDLTGTNRAVLLYLLARKWRRDESAEIDLDELGWVGDDDLAVGIWGRDGVGRSIKVVVCRLRAELREAGFDPWFIEKRRGALRIRVREADVS